MVPPPVFSGSLVQQPGRQFSICSDIRSSSVRSVLRMRLLLALFAGGLLFSQSVLAQHLHFDAEPQAECGVCLQLDQSALAVPEPGPTSFVPLSPVARAEAADAAVVALPTVGYRTRAPPRS